MHGQFNNSLVNDLPTKQLFDKLSTCSFYDLDLFNLNINRDINPDENFAYKQIRSNYYILYKFFELKTFVSDLCLSFLRQNIRSLKRNIENFQDHLPTSCLPMLMQILSSLTLIYQVIVLSMSQHLSLPKVLVCI